MKNVVTITKAAKLAGISRTTLYDKLNNGELSKTSDNKIEISELLRVYPDIKLGDKEDQQPDKLNNQKSDTLNTALQFEIEQLKTENRFLTEKVEILEATILELKNDKEEERADKKVFRDLTEQKLIPNLSTEDNAEHRKKGWFFNRK